MFYKTLDNLRMPKLKANPGADREGVKWMGAVLTGRKGAADTIREQELEMRVQAMKVELRRS